eukprot:9451428-Ditylum_brightwellii.AAC.1
MEISIAFSVALGGAAPKHIINVDNESNPDSWVLPEQQMANEIKCTILTAQSCPKNITPFKAIAALPQTTNAKGDDYNQACVNAVIKCGGTL